jgi:hypothetical protein
MATLKRGETKPARASQSAQVKLHNMYLTASVESGYFTEVSSFGVLHEPRPGSQGILRLQLIKVSSLDQQKLSGSREISPPNHAVLSTMVLTRKRATVADD